jgi:CHAT domain-containing protein
MQREAPIPANALRGSRTKRWRKLSQHLPHMPAAPCYNLLHVTWRSHSPRAAGSGDRAFRGAFVIRLILARIVPGGIAALALICALQGAGRAAGANSADSADDARTAGGAGDASGTATPVAADQLRADDQTRLDAHARALLDARAASSRSGARGSYSAALADDLAAIADSLERACSDSLAWRCHREAAALLARRGRSAEAVTHNEQALRLALANGSLAMVLDSRIALADAYRTAGRLEEAIATARGAVQDAFSAGDSLSIADASNALGSACLLIGRLSEAGDAHSQALSVARATGDTPNLIEALCGMAQYLHLSDRNSEGLVHADSAVTLARLAGSLHRRAVSYNVRSIILSALARQPEALADIDSACAIDERSGNRRHLVQSRLSRARVYQRMGRTDACLAETDSLLAMPEATEGDNRARVLALRGIALIEARRFTGAEQLLSSMVTQVEQRRRELAEESSQAAVFYYGGQAYTTLSRCYLEQGRIEEAWNALQRGRSAVLRGHVEPIPPPDPTIELSRLRQELGRANAALVQYNDASRNPMVAFILTGDSLQVVSLGIAHHAAAAETSIQLLSGGAPDSLSRAALKRVAQRVLADVVRQIPTNVTRLYIAPPSDLSGFPFEELPIADSLYNTRSAADGTSPTTLGDRYAITYLPSADLLLALLDRACTGEGMVLVADPSLPATKEEVRRLAIPGARLFEGKEVSKAKLFEALGMSTSAVLHFATHATIDAVRPDHSALRLTGETELTVAEIESLSLAADLVTLSGCSTSAGHTYIGEGTLGLPRAFLIAGARSVVSSLWDVEDQATMQFMTFFYAKLREGLPRDECLQAARLEMRRAGFSTRDRAAFVLTGVGHLPVACLAHAPTPFHWRPYAWGAGAAMLLAMGGGITRRVTAKSGRGRMRG